MPTRALRFLPALLLLSGCKKDGAVPAYILVNTPVVVVNNGADTISSRITDLWVYINDEPVGVWEIGDRIPLIGSGSSEIKLIAGIRKNGVIDDRIQYPFYATWTAMVDLVPEQNVVLNPAFRYFDNVSIWEESFSNAGVMLDVDTSYSDTVLIRMNDGAGNDHGAAYIDAAHPSFQCYAIQNFSITTGTAAFLELDYSCDLQFQVGLRYLNSAGNHVDAPYITVNPTVRGDGSMPWNKIYIDMATPWASVNSSQKTFFIRTTLGDLTQGQLHVDNIRLVRP